MPKLYNILILQESSGVNFLFCFLMMLLDTLLYCAIGLYLDKVCLISWIVALILACIEPANQSVEMEKKIFVYALLRWKNVEIQLKKLTTVIIIWSQPCFEETWSS